MARTTGMMGMKGRLNRVNMVCLCAVLLGAPAPGCATPRQRREQFSRELERLSVGLVLDQWHSAAAHGLFDEYFDSMSADSVFLGTDPGERWTKAEFMAYAAEPFSDGEGWTYTPRDRYIEFAQGRKTAWADELLEHERYGLLRGTAVLIEVKHEWKIAHYSLTFLVPNEKAAAVVELIGGR